LMDCGVRAVQTIQQLKENGVAVIVCDHHEAGDILPIADAILDAKQLDCPYPFKELCGCGVTFKLFQAFCIQQSIDEEKLFQFIDLVAVATCADIVPMLGENRILVKIGLEKINTNPMLGFEVLQKKSGFDGVMNVRSLVFGFAPRINAAGRIYHAKRAVELLTAKDKTIAETWADEIEKYNTERKTLDKGITEEVLAMIEENPSLKDKKSTVLASENWHKGVIGIVASRCIEHYHRPTIILKETDGYLTGSARSVGEFDLLKALTKCDNLLDKYGGHKFAAGLSLHKNNFELFVEKFEQEVSKTINEADLRSKISIEQELPLERINFNFYNFIAKMEPFGPKNMQPIFMSSAVIIEDEIQVLKEEHLKFQLTTPVGKIDCLAFGMLDDLTLLSAKKLIDLVYSIEVNEYKNTKRIQLMIRAVRPSLAEIEEKN
jgi:single-stranded-DNA-specific exonuclease